MTLWRPIDFYFSVAWTKKRLLEVPYVIHHAGKELRCLRVEFTLLFSVVLIVDFAPVRLFQRRSRSAS